MDTGLAAARCIMAANTLPAPLVNEARGAAGLFAGGGVGAGDGLLLLKKAVRGLFVPRLPRAFEAMTTVISEANHDT